MLLLHFRLIKRAHFSETIREGINEDNSVHSKKVSLDILQVQLKKTTTKLYNV